MIDFMSDRATWKKLRKRLQDLDCTVTQLKSGHYKVYDSDGRTITTMAASTSCPRAYRNQIADLRRQGIAI